jgi:hypothetical protein
MMEAVGPSETLVNINKTIRRHILEDNKLHSYVYVYTESGQQKWTGNQNG